MTLPIAEVHRSPWLPEGTLLITSPGFLRVPPIPHPVVTEAVISHDWRIPLRSEVLRPLDLLRLFRSVRTSRSPERIWREDWWNDGARHGWWEE